MSKKVFVGISGGVDSAVSAALLKEQGYEVTGCFIKIWRPEFLECTWKEDRLDALRIAAALHIPFREIDLSAEYQREVVDTMLADYARGVTPNPDVLCNEKIKFGSFAKWAFENGADLIATGHYARTENRQLLRAVDQAKDQSYFLYRVAASELSRTIFPIGGMHKSEVRAEAARFGLPNAAKPDSQGLCFVGEISMTEFLKRFITVEPGPVIDQQGKVIGTHEGAGLYTVGQRHGFTTTSSIGPSYVVGVDAASNTLVVSNRREDAAKEKVQLLHPHWINERPDLSKRYRAQARYHERDVGVQLQEHDGSLTANFDEPHIVSSGQSLVIYDGERCLGGAVIQ